jgi:hypothetical protein
VHDLALLFTIAVALFFSLRIIIGLVARVKTRKVERFKAEVFEPDSWSFDRPKVSEFDARSEDRWVLG